METLDRRLILALSLAIVALIAVGGWLYVENERQLQLSAQADLEAIARLKVDQIAEVASGKTQRCGL